MVIREMTKLQKRKTLTRKEKDDLRRKKLKELRKGQGAGAPFKPSLHNTREQLNVLREKEIQRVRNNMNLAGADYQIAQRYGIFERPENTPFKIKIKRKGGKK
jgi:hypothetical protein